MKYLFVALLLFWSLVSAGQKPAFKGAAGFGATATGGQKNSNGSLYHVTNLQDSGPGSFREAVSQPGRIIVFDTAGVIRLKSRIDVKSNTTINGWSAPAPGITLYGASVAFNHISNVIVRYIRMHGSINMSRGSCVLIADSSDRLIFDHVSVTWGRWDNVHIKGSSNMTMQYCLIGESLDPQRFGALLEGPQRLSIHHCLWIDNQSRNPKAKAEIIYKNNVIYNWGTSGFVGGHSAADHYQDLINNYFIAGPSSKKSFLAMFTPTDHVYQSGNRADLNKNGRLDGRLVTRQDFITDRGTATMSLKRQVHAPLPAPVSTAQKAVQQVIRQAGCSNYRDTTDLRLISQLKSLGKKGAVIWTETMVGGQQ